MPKERRSANINQPRVTSTTGLVVVSGGGGGGSQPGTLTGSTTNTITSAGLHYHAVQLAHSALLGVAADDHHDPVTVGNTGLSVSGQQVSLNLAAVSGLEVDGGLRLADSIAGDGLSIANKVLAVGVSGLGLSVGADAVTLTSSSNPGAAASILASDASGYLQLTRIGLGTAPSYPLHVSGDAVVTQLGVGMAPTVPLDVTGAAHIDGDLTFVGAQSILTTADSLTLAPAADLNLTPGGTARVRATSGVRLQSDNYVSQMTGWGIGYNGGADFRYLYTDELHAKSFITDLEQALAGGQIIAKSVAVVAVDFTVPAAGSAETLTVEDLPGASGQAVFQAGDVVRLRQFTRSSGSLSIADCWGVVTGYTDNGDGTQAWTFTRSAGAQAGMAVAGSAIAAKTLALDYGVSGNGFYEVNAIDGLWAQNSPYAQVVTWTTHPQSGQVVRSRWGNLKGVFAQADDFGLYAAVAGHTDADQYLRISSLGAVLHNLPLELYASGDKVLALDPTGPSLALGNPIPTGWLTQTGLWAGRHTDGTYRAYLGTVSGGTLAQGWQWDGSALTVRGAIVVQPGSSGLANMSDANLDNVADGATYKRTTANEKAGGARGYAGLDTSGNVARVIRGSAIAAGSAATGLNLTADYLGYYDGTAFRTYLDKNGNFLFSRPGGASLLWSASAGKLQGRDSSNNVQWETDATTGAIVAGGGRVTLDTAGAHLIGNSSTDTTQAALQFRDGEASSARYARLWGWGASGDGYHLKMGFDNDAGWGVYPYIDMRVGLGIQTVSIYTGASSYARFSSSALSLTGLDLTVSGGLNLGTATGAGAGQAFLKTSNWPVLKVERSTTAITDAQGGLYLLATTSGNMVDGFGTEFHFVIRDSAGVDNDIARLQAIRAGADNSGALTFGVKNAGSWVEAFRAVPSGRVLIGTTSDDGVNMLQVNGPIAAASGWVFAPRLIVPDGIAAPATSTGNAQIYVDSADGDLKVKFGDGTVKTIVTDS